LRIDVLSRFLPPLGQRIAGVIVDVFAAAIALVLAWQSWRFVAQSRVFEDELLGGLPAWPFQAILPVAFVLIGWGYLRDLPRHFKVPPEVAES
jgi:TRAP-type C4-dicarboxylate transport system permease small subunit